MARLVIILCVLSAPAASPIHVCQDEKLPLPNAESLKEAEKLVRDVFKDDYAKKAPADRRALAQKLLKQAAESRDDATARYVLLREAQDLASQAGDLETAVQAIDELSRTYAVSGPDLKQGALSAIEKSARSPEECRRVSSAYAKLAEDALTAGLFETAEKACESSASWAKKGKDVSFVSKAEARLKEVKEVRTRRAAVAAAEKVLASNPSDPAANSAVGLFKCLALGEWEAGLPLLGKGPDGAFKAVALKDLANPTDPAAGVAVGDAWWDLAEKETGTSKANLRKRAAHWYDKAMTGLSGLTKVRAEKRLREAGGEPSGIDLLKLVDPAKDSVKGAWTLNRGALHSPETVPHSHLEFPFEPPEEYDLKLVVERLSGTGSLDLGLNLEQRSFLLVVDGYGEVVTGLDTLDGKPANANETTNTTKFLAQGKVTSLHCSVRKTGVEVKIDGKSAVSWKGTSGRLGLPGVYHPRNTRLLFVGGYRTDMRITQATLYPVTGTGTKTR